jgi:hypothetical protein
MSEDVQLRIGDPREGPATSTQFVLPFAYSPMLDSAGNDQWVFHVKPVTCIEDIRWRTDYFTRETAEVLYHGARWAELSGPDPIATFPISDASRPVRVAVARPRLILFEWPVGDARKRQGAGGPIDPQDPEQILKTGFLILETYFPDQHSPVLLSDVLRLNDAFRFWQQPWAAHFDPERRTGFAGFLRYCPVNFLADQQLTVETVAEQSKAYLDRWASLLDVPVQGAYPADRWRLMPSSWLAAARRWCRDDRGTLREDGWMAGYSDPRAFVWTAVITDRGGDDLRAAAGLRDAPASRLPAWIHLLNVDASDSAATPFEQRWAAERTYRRWEDTGTFYGFSSHAAAMVAPMIERPPLAKIFRTLYFDQTLLLLYLRVTTFRFSRALTDISRRANIGDENSGRWWRSGGAPVEEFEREFNDLRWAFARFTNLYEFPLLSSQQQGIEMYSLARRRMEVTALFREVQQEVQNSHDYLEMQLQRRRTEATTRLSVVATIGLVPALALAFFGMAEPVLKRLWGHAWRDIDLTRLRATLAVASVLGICALGMWLLAYFAKPIGTRLGIFRSDLPRAKRAKQSKLSETRR